MTGDVLSELRVRSRVRDYVVRFADDGAWAEGLSVVEHAFVVVDENVQRLHGTAVLAPLQHRAVEILLVTEERKTFASVQALAESATARAAKRNCVVVSIGGGITQDVTGFLASTLYRGVRWIYVPTTLLAMADSCIGGKTSLNLSDHKNLLGTVYPPELVLIHTPFVATLSGDDYASGLGEVIKLHLLGGEEQAARLRVLLPRLLRRDPPAVRAAIAASLRIKRDFIEDDEFDRGRRNLLNLGHCFGHALETVSGFAVPHGQAIVIGMLLADRVAEERGLLAPRAGAERREQLYLPVLRSRPVLDAPAREAVVAAMRFDKKRTGEGLALVMLGNGLRATRVDDVDPREALAALEALPDLLSP